MVPAIWNADGAKFAAWSWADNAEGSWSSIQEGAELITFSIAQSANNVIFVRLSSEASAPDWSSVWNQTEDLVIPVDKDVYTITGWGEGENPKSVGTWDEVGGEVPPVVNPEEVTVRFYSDWSVVNAYAWGGSDFGEWPGKALTKGNDGWYSAVIAKGANIIFNDGSLQTVNIENVQSDVCYELGETDAEGHFYVVVNENCTLGDEPIIPQPANDVYYLVGYINGADYGFGDVADEYKAYEFKDGKLKAKFDQDSYVFVRTDENMYMTNGWLGTDVTSAELFIIEEGGDKLYVPAGEFNFTLQVRDNSLFLSYAPTTALNDVEAAKVVVTDNMLNVTVNSVMNVSIYTVSGQMLDSKTVNSNYTRSLNSGMYIIRIGEQSFKAVIH